MGKYEDQYGKKAIEAGNRFIERIKNKTFKKQIQINTFPEYPIEKAASSFDAFVKSNQFKALLTDDPK